MAKTPYKIICKGDVSYYIRRIKAIKSILASDLRFIVDEKRGVITLTKSVDSNGKASNVRTKFRIIQNKIEPLNFDDMGIRITKHLKKIACYKGARIAEAKTIRAISYMPDFKGWGRGLDMLIINNWFVVYCSLKTDCFIVSYYKRAEK